jgi:hypothetical protein
VDDEVRPLGASHADLEELTGGTRPDQHGQVIKDEDADGMSVSVEHVVVSDPLSACARQDEWIH